MNEAIKKFEVIFNDKTVKIEQVLIGGENMFRILARDVPPFFITRTENYTKKFWTSVPEGKQELAEEIGALIEKYFKEQS